MTILEASIRLFDWFRSNDSFSLDEPANLIKLEINTKEEVAAFSIALERLEKLEIIKGVDVTKGNKNAKIYVMEKHMQNFSQTVNLNGAVAFKISECINRFCEKIKDTTDLCDPLNISEKDISNLTLICNFSESGDVVNSPKNDSEDFKNN